MAAALGPLILKYLTAVEVTSCITSEEHPQNINVISVTVELTEGLNVPTEKWVISCITLLELPRNIPVICLTMVQTEGLRVSQWGGDFYDYRLKFWLFYGYRLIFFSYG